MKNITQLSLYAGGFSFSYNMHFEITPETTQSQLDLIISQIAHSSDTAKQRDVLTQMVTESAAHCQESGENRKLYLYGYDTDETNNGYTRLLWV